MPKIGYQNIFLMKQIIEQMIYEKRMTKLHFCLGGFSIYENFDNVSFLKCFIYGSDAWLTKNIDKDNIFTYNMEDSVNNKQ